VTRVNRRAEELLGLARADILGRDLRSLPPRSVTSSSPPSGATGSFASRSLSAAARDAPGGDHVPDRRRGRNAGGAVMIFDDPTPRHLLHRERQTSQTLDLLNRVLLG